MKGHDLQFEELHVPKPIGLPLHRLDLVVGTLQWPGRADMDRYFGDVTCTAITKTAARMKERMARR
jgi:hypothetical protein